jgi:O-antigen/teichoic acid export membrane protein
VINHSNLRIAMILLVASIVILLFMGIQAGLRQDWMRMSLFFFSTVLVVFFFTMSLMGLQINTRFRYIENIVLEKSGSDRPVMTKPLNRRIVHKLNQVIVKVVGVCMVISVPIFIFLAVIAGLHEKWFVLGVYLLACSISVIISMVLLTALAIVRHSDRLEKIASKKIKEQTQQAH